MSHVFGMRLHPPPPLTRVVAYADTARAAALAHLPPGADGQHLAGRTRDGQPLGQHTHTHWLPRTDGRLLHGLVAWCPAGWSSAELAAVATVRRLHGSHIRPVTVEPEPVQWPEEATCWAALTPYVPGRHDVDLAEDVIRECGYRGLPALRAVVELPGDGQRWSTRRPTRLQPRRPPDPVRAALRFAAPVSAPLALGRLAHFGLGMWWPVNPDVLRAKWGVQL